MRGCLSTAQIRHDRAVRAVLAPAGFNQVLERADHFFELLRLCLHLGDVRIGDRTHFDIAPFPVVPQVQKITDAVDGKPEITRTPDEDKAVDVGIIVIAVAAILARRLRQKGDRLVVPDHFGGNAGLVRCLTDIHGFKNGVFLNKIKGALAGLSARLVQKPVTLAHLSQEPRHARFGKILVRVSQ